MLLAILLSMPNSCISVASPRRGYMGCYIDIRNPRDMKKGPVGGVNKKWSFEGCQQQCSQYVYFGLQWHGQCWCGDAFSTTRDHKRVADKECGSDGRGRGWRSAVYQVSPMDPQSGYQGCYVDDKNRDLEVGPIGGKKRDWNHDTCRIRCAQYKYFSLQYHGECFCGNRFSTAPVYKKVDDKQCGADRLGRGWRNSVYRVSQSTPSGYVGCYVDNRQRDLKVGPIGGPKTRAWIPKNCRTACAQYQYFGVQDNGQCFCGNAYSTAPAYKQVNDDECGPNFRGGPWRNAIYRVPKKLVARQLMEKKSNGTLVQKSILSATALSPL